MASSSNRSGRHPFKVKTRVRAPLRLPFISYRRYRLSVQDASLSRWKAGFDSRYRYQ